MVMFAILGALRALAAGCQFRRIGQHPNVA